MFAPGTPRSASPQQELWRPQTTEGTQHHSHGPHREPAASNPEHSLRSHTHCLRLLNSQPPLQNKDTVLIPETVVPRPTRTNLKGQCLGVHQEPARVRTLLSRARTRRQAGPSPAPSMDRQQLAWPRLPNMGPDPRHSLPSSSQGLGFQPAFPFLPQA